jgi:hypothetical protein
VRIVAHQSKDAPPAHAWIAAYYEGTERLPMVFFGETKEIAVARAGAWLVAEQAKEAAQRLAAVERGRKRTAA